MRRYLILLVLAMLLSPAKAESPADSARFALDADQAVCVGHEWSRPLQSLRIDSTGFTLLARRAGM